MSDVVVPPAWLLLEYASTNDTVLVEDAEKIDALLAAARWDDLVVHAMRHRLIPRLADFLVRSGLMSHLPRESRRILMQSLHDNRHKVALSCGEAHAVVSAMRDHGVPVVCTKGIAFQYSLYGGFGGRAFNDIDLLIEPDHRSAAEDVLTGLGYLANMEHDLCKGGLSRRSRRDLAMFAMYPDHLPHFFRPLTGSALPHFMVDVCFSITWFGAAWQIPMSEVLAETDTVTAVTLDGSVRLPVLAAPYDFIFTVMHLFREGWFQRTVLVKGLRLGQFADVRRQWQRLDAATIAGLAGLIDRHAIGPPVAWVCHHVDQLFGSDIVGSLGLGRYCDDAWLHSASAVDGSFLSWTGGMRERLRAEEPPALVAAPEPPFAAQARVARTRSSAPAPAEGTHEAASAAETR
ncbi:MAG: nucleotidyltransferase family protein [Actinophytocola sp.]|uniref:nucleotidyltransferase family protein n=1 Tax=Actinophytocola sp. TaxID=1872138 RepID=UPI003C7662EA